MLLLNGFKNESILNTGCAPTMPRKEPATFQLFAVIQRIFVFLALSLFLCWCHCHSRCSFMFILSLLIKFVLFLSHFIAFRSPPSLSYMHIRKAEYIVMKQTKEAKKNQRANAIIITSRYNMTLTLAYFIFISLIFHSFRFFFSRAVYVSALSLSPLPFGPPCVCARSSSITTAILILYRRCSSESVFTHFSFYLVRFRVYTNSSSSSFVRVFSTHFASLVHLFISFHILFYCKFSVSMSNRFTHTYSHH